MSLIDKLKKYIVKGKEGKFSFDETEQINMIYDQITKELKAFEEDFSFIKDRSDFKDKVKEVEDKILSLIEENDKVLIVQNNNYQNIGMLAAKLRLENVVLRALENDEASTQQDGFTNMNIGMFAAYNQLQKATMKALDNKKASCQQENYGRTIGMLAAQSKFEDCVLKALENNEACKKYDYRDENIEIYCARYSLENATLKVLDDKEMMEDIGCLISFFMAVNAMKDPLKKVIIQYPEVIEELLDRIPLYSNIMENINEAKAQIERDKLMEEDIENSAEIEIENESN